MILELDDNEAKLWAYNLANLSRHQESEAACYALSMMANRIEQELLMQTIPVPANQP